MKSLMLCVVGLLAGCDAEQQDDSTPTGRWYTAAQVAQGKMLFRTHCASCHGESAEGTANWRKADASGNYPPPPLNGAAHAWHHPLSVLEQTIAEGGVALGGTMPGFAAVLDTGQARSTIAYFQSFWTDEIYQRWLELERR